MLMVCCATQYMKVRCDMWWVTETLMKDKPVTGTFGPFPKYKDALEFLVASEYPWTEDNMFSVTIQKKDEV